MNIRRNAALLLGFSVSLLLSAIVVFGQGTAGNRYRVQSGKISFQSEAPKEMIAAQTGTLSGIIDLSKKAFAFKVPIASFRGFNSPLQRDHFNENYMQSSRFPEATFTGKIIEDIDVHTPGQYEVRAKGRLMIHGLAVERMIRGQVTVSPGRLELKASFTVPLADHQILIPRLVSEKLAQVIAVDMSATLLPE